MIPTVSIFLVNESRKLLDNKHLWINAGDSIVIQCDTTGVPAPRMLWYHDGNAVKMQDYDDNNNSCLTVADISESDEGMFVVVAKNIGGNDRTNFTLHVKNIEQFSSKN